MPNSDKARKKPSAFDNLIVDALKADEGRASGVFVSAHPEVWADVKIEEEKQIYRVHYWDVIRGDEVNQISQKLALSMFDWAVHTGPQRSIVFLQRCLGIDPAIGKFARLTMKALQQYEDKDELVTLYNKMRDDYYAKLVSGNAARYGAYKRDWKNRMTALRRRLGEIKRLDS